MLAVPESIVKEEQEDEFVPFEVYQDPVSTETTPTSRVLNENSGRSNCTMLMGDSTTEHSQSSNGEKPQEFGGLRRHPIVTRSGIISKPNSQYQDYVS